MVDPYFRRDRKGHTFTDKGRAGAEADRGEKKKARARGWGKLNSAALPLNNSESIGANGRAGKGS